MAGEGLGRFCKLDRPAIPQVRLACFEKTARFPTLQYEIMRSLLNPSAS
jgi:hypothetical protein